ncbi:Two-component response regulator, AmiR/NasT family, consists of REC and RNA-binding antiterminator (ANTAR) domains [Poseidonocella pacifica]|uniref:Two-component response regulator, AmiR/NasT family, consists of REC and RNA-binding antiterminator (ANTAR) domains n=1 Tax=Poseidonocella pacifica TaxID=871651 RepID=A0A1I0V2I3_9RHOB|nr:ANTAR domain-containing protein [Poseidonocella pacifica]SFA70300.1 Two-component response regulator, AmiR/NasT family, consists of REC and RNA-binding antiterminator (ANTAR) domains [Poseidonocella pacifica]
MRRKLRIPDLGGARAAILHRPHPTVSALTRQLEAIGLDVDCHWPELPPSARAADYLFIDVDTAHEDQFPWAPGEAPMPMIALVGSEAPGRIEWLMNFGADAQILKPVGDGGAYSALLIARATFDARAELACEIEALRRRLGQRQTVVRAVAMLATRGKSEDEAYAQLRGLAMAWRVSFEEAAERIVAPAPGEETDNG